jgi:peptidoglycan-N-acetylglucosamine deacetylase
VERRALLGRLALLTGSVAASAFTVGTVEQDERTFDEDRWRSSVGEQMSTGTLPVTWSAPASTGRTAALTFDDGPTTRFTPELLKTLSRYQIKATFFMIGALVERQPELVRRVVDAGHEVANHTYDHESAAVRTAAQVRTSVQRGSESIHRVIGSPPRWLRPPRGELTTATLAAARQANLELALWSVNRGDGPDSDSDAVAEHLATALRPGSVVDLHDGIGRSAWVGHPDPHLITRRRAELAALPAAVESWLAAGYRFQTLSELIPRQPA